MDWTTDEKLTAFLKRVGKNIRILRVEHDLAQDTLAREAGLQPSHVSKLENGHHNPSLVTVKRIADALGVPVADLFAGTGERS